MSDRHLDPSVVRQLIRYDADGGKLYWIKRSIEEFTSKRACSVWNARYADTLAINTLSPDGYLVGRLYDRPMRAHRVAWAIYYGSWPEDQIDHINGIRVDNRISNLRSATRAQNQYNKAKKANSTNSLKGVRWHKRDKRWVARIGHGGKSTHLGTYESELEAYLAYCAAAKRIHGEFARFE